MEIEVSNNGYLSFDQVKDMIINKCKFGIYENKKGNHFLVHNCIVSEIYCYKPKFEQMNNEFDLWSGNITPNLDKKISNAYGKIVFDSTKNTLDDLSLEGWNHKQIISYMKYSDIVASYFLINKGHIPLEKVQEMVNEGVPFGIYRNSKGNCFLVYDVSNPFIKGYKVNLKKLYHTPNVEKRIKNTCGELIFDSNKNKIIDLTTEGWDGKQIITYEIDKDVQPFSPVLDNATEVLRKYSSEKRFEMNGKVFI